VNYDLMMKFSRNGVWEEEGEQEYSFIQLSNE
jgi:hypothetical protein